MSRYLMFAALAASFLGAGCAIHPLPEDVTGVPTYYIVRQIRCEARSAVISSAINGLNNYEIDDPEVQRIARSTMTVRGLSPASPKDFRNPEFAIWSDVLRHRCCLQLQPRND